MVVAFVVAFAGWRLRAGVGRLPEELTNPPPSGW
jgi:hypothetical protein